MKHKNIAFFIPHAGCQHRCSFCDQRAISGSQTMPSADEVRQTLSEAYDRIADKSETEIAFFGGSFTAIPEEMMQMYLAAARPFLGEGGFSGIRISTRPDAVPEEMLSVLKKYGVTTIELGAQSMQDAVLQKNGRGHTAEDVRDASRRIKQRGFSLGLQMMVGLPGDTDSAGVLDTAKELLALSPDCVRIYPAVILPHTQMAAWYESGEYVPMAFSEAVSVCAKLLELFESAGVPVIRLGLHDAPEVSKNHIGGIYHPAFRELCEGAIYLKRAKEQLFCKGHGRYIAEVRPDCISKMVGQRRQNIISLSEAGYILRVQGNPALQKYEILLKGDASPCF